MSVREPYSVVATAATTNAKQLSDYAARRISIQTPSSSARPHKLPNLITSDETTMITSINYYSANTLSKSTEVFQHSVFMHTCSVSLIPFSQVRILGDSQTIVLYRR
jgi:hypothetical protein